MAATGIDRVRWNLREAPCPRGVNSYEVSESTAGVDAYANAHQSGGNPI